MLANGRFELARARLSSKRFCSWALALPAAQVLDRVFWANEPRALIIRFASFGSVGYALDREFVLAKLIRLIVAMRCIAFRRACYIRYKLTRLR